MWLEDKTPCASAPLPSATVTLRLNENVENIAINRKKNQEILHKKLVLKKTKKIVLLAQRGFMQNSCNQM
jgi:hypothetical protein